MKMILFLAAVYSLIINQCYQKKTVAKSFPPKYIGTIAKQKDKDSLATPQVKPLPAVYIMSSLAAEPDYMPRYSVMR
jgi:hypothetical protein